MKNKSRLNDWITKNYDELVWICRKVTKEYYVDDLFQMCIEQFLNYKKIDSVPEKDWKFFFARLVRNNFFSSTSNYATTYRKFKFVEMGFQDIQNTEYTEALDLDWVKQQIAELKKTEWYYARIFELYIEEECNLTKLSKRTTIPMNSLSRDINRFRKKLIDRRKQYYNGM